MDPFHLTLLTQDPFQRMNKYGRTFPSSLSAFDGQDNTQTGSKEAGGCGKALDKGIIVGVICDFTDPAEAWSGGLRLQEQSLNLLLSRCIWFWVAHP